MKSKSTNNITLAIPQPCTENWDKMTATEQGRHCTNCNKTVIDFSNYTDKELADFFKKAQGKVCGRVNNYQVNRSILLTEQPNRSIFHKLLYGTALASWIGIASTANAQSNNTSIQTEQKDAKQAKDTTLNTSAKTCSNYIHGELTDGKSNQPLPFSNVMLYENGTQIAQGVTDIDGKFTIGPFGEFHGQKLELKCVNEGYRDSTIIIKSVKNFASIKMKMAATQINMGIIICIPPNKSLYTPDGATFNRNDTPYLPPK
jgi:hypothetical protein